MSYEYQKLWIIIIKHRDFNMIEKNIYTNIEFFDLGFLHQFFFRLIDFFTLIIKYINTQCQVYWTQIITNNNIMVIIIKIDQLKVKIKSKR